jgi:hypothetical protein
MRTAATGDEGISLTELIVSMGLMTLIGALATLFFVGMDTANSKTVNSVNASSSARNALQQWTDLLRLADSSTTTAGSGNSRFVEIKPSTMTFYANLNNRAADGSARTAPTKISLSLESGQLVQRVFGTSSTRTLYFGTAVSTTGWLFQPYVSGSPPLLSEPNDCSGGTAGLCSTVSAGDAILRTVVRVDIAFTVTPTTGPVQTYTSSASITGATS